ncbi:MAG: hypothetical protein DRR08_05060 [Candidatus Parabeggiatoa sp. nov. 2]|nr:MAG: hypothetical protein DRR08_05060 [Gammaproteobacteria bacterium]
MDNMIKHFKVIGLYHKMNFDFKFNDDLNILTGKNGVGKTTVLRLIWYLISGNIDKIMPTIDFDELEIETNRFMLNLKVSRQSELSMSWNIGNGKQTKTLNMEPSEVEKASQMLNQDILKVSQSTTFFPTFRRIEGGFATDKPLKKEMGELYDAFLQEKIYHGLENAFSDLSNYLSVEKHQFVTSVSTDDLTRLLTQQYAEISERINQLQNKLSQFITERTSNTFSSATANTKSERLEQTLKEIQSKVDEVKTQKEELLRPFTVLSDTVKEIFQYEGLQITETMTLGNALGSMASEKLSSGEKQMLSFLCYNAFINNSIILVDEPELSLHVDWQRLLLRILMQQGTQNQFIVATHSPFIYAKYPEKELRLDKGNE